MTSKEALEKIKLCWCCQDFIDNECRRDEECVYKAIEKDLEVMEIIKKKPWILNEIVEAKDYQVYKSWCSIFRADINYRATETEFNLIKEWLER